MKTINITNIIIFAIVVYLCIGSYIGIFGDCGRIGSASCREAKYASIIASLLYSTILLVRIRWMDRGWKVVSYSMISLAVIAIALAGYCIYRGY